jgi:uncharacterized protein DUF4118
MDSESEAFWLAVGIGGAIVLGIALVPLRGFTPAANFTFAFMALTIVVAELGGKRAAIASAVTSALSLDFFLTRPYLRLSMEDKHDLIAFVGLAFCGLIAAAFGTRRTRRSVHRRHLDLLHEALLSLPEAGPPATRLLQLLDLARTTLPVSSLAVRDDRGALVAGTPRAASYPRPSVSLSMDALMRPGSGLEPLQGRGAPLPTEGASLELVAANRTVGALELWGDGQPADANDLRVLSDVARSIGARLALANAPRS